MTNHIVKCALNLSKVFRAAIERCNFPIYASILMNSLCTFDPSVEGDDVCGDKSMKVLPEVTVHMPCLWIYRCACSISDSYYRVIDMRSSADVDRFPDKSEKETVNCVRFVRISGSMRPFWTADSVAHKPPIQGYCS